MVWNLEPGSKDKISHQEAVKFDRLTSTLLDAADTILVEMEKRGSRVFVVTDGSFSVQITKR